MSVSTSDLIDRYLAAAAARDTEALVGLFSQDGVVIDEDKTWRGPSEIRAWRAGPAAAYQYTTELLGIEHAGGADYVARVRLDGNFPGGTVELRHRFTIDADGIHRLEIAP
jgi:hypothetical protein